MSSENMGVEQLIRKKVYTIVSLLLLLMFILTSIILFSSYNNKKEYVLIDVFGRQRMLTQKLSKDANRKFAIMQALDSGPFVETDKTLVDRLDGLNRSMTDAKSEFQQVMHSLHTGQLITDEQSINYKKSIKQMAPLIQQTDEAWANFNDALSNIVESNQVNEQTAESLIYINLNNEQLLQYCDDILKDLIQYQKSYANRYMVFALGLFFISLILLLISIYQLQKYMIIPLNELYKGIRTVGLLNNNKVKSIPTKKELMPVVGQINESFEKLRMLVRLIENINQDTSFEGILNYIYLSFSAFIPYSHIGIALLKENGQVLEASYGISSPELNDLPKKLVGLRARISETSLEKIIINGGPRVINDLDMYPTNKDSEYNQIIMEAGIRASITLPLKINNKPVGIIFFSSTEKNIYNESHISFLETLSSSIAISLNKNIFIDELIYSTILALAKMAESRDEDTGDHLERMKQYSLKITELLVRDRKYCEMITVGFIKGIERFSPMHDIGKVGIRDGILLKPGKLTKEEFEEMKQHAVYGAEVLRTAEKNIEKHNNSLFKMGIEIAEGHHEKWNGSGYPYGKSGEDIPLSARIVAVADVFDALTSKRPYKEAFSFEKSFEMVVEGQGTHFDPEIIDTIIHHKEEVLALYTSFNVENPNEPIEMST